MSDVAPPATPPPRTFTDAALELDAVHQVRELRRELDIFARAALADRQISRDQNEAVHHRIDELEQTLGGKLTRLLKHLGADRG